MQYSKLQVVYLNIKDMPMEFLTEFREFLRLGMITPVTRGMEGANGLSEEKEGSKKWLAFYSGCFTVLAAQTIETWLKEKGVKFVERQER